MNLQSEVSICSQNGICRQNHIRLQKFLASAGIGSRRTCEEYIKQGRVQVNGQTITEMGILINPEKDEILFHGKKIHAPQNYIYYILNKPKGYTTTTSDPHATHNVLELIPTNIRFFPVGRLDKDSRGLLILTNDGELTNQLTHPRFEHEKEYQVKTKIISDNLNSRQIIEVELQKLENGVFLDGEKTNPAKIFNIEINLSTKTISFNIILKEGRNRQIRRMAEIIGLEALDLTRVRIGKINLGNLPEGKYKQIEKHDII